MQLVKPKIIFACESSVDVLLEAVRSQNSQIKIIVFGRHPQVESLTDIMSRQSDVDVRKYKPREIENPMHDTAIILFSSGTSGLPKAVTHCYGKAIDNFFHFMLLTPKIGLWYSALCWISGTYLTFRFLLTGSTWILHSGFDVDETFKVLNQFKVEMKKIRRPSILIHILFNNNIFLTEQGWMDVYNVTNAGPHKQEKCIGKTQR